MAKDAAIRKKVRLSSIVHADADHELVKFITGSYLSLQERGSVDLLSFFQHSSLKDNFLSSGKEKSANATNEAQLTALLNWYGRRKTPGAKLSAYTCIRHKAEISWNKQSASLFMNLYDGGTAILT